MSEMMSESGMRLTRHSPQAKASAEIQDLLRIRPNWGVV